MFHADWQREISIRLLCYNIPVRVKLLGPWLHKGVSGKATCMPDFSRLYDAILNGDDRMAIQLINEALQEKADPAELITKGMIPAMDEVGRLFEAQEYFI